MPRGLVLIPYITEYDHYERCSPGEAGMGWFRSILRFNRSVRRKVSTTRLHAGFRAFHEFEKFPSEGGKILLPYKVDGRSQFLFLRVTKVEWPRSLCGPYLFYCVFDMGLPKEDMDFFEGRTHKARGIFSRNILNDLNRTIGKTYLDVAQSSKFFELVRAWNASQIHGLDYWCKKRELKTAA